MKTPLAIPKWYLFSLYIVSIILISASVISLAESLLQIHVFDKILFIIISISTCILTGLALGSVYLFKKASECRIISEDEQAHNNNKDYAMIIDSLPNLVAYVDNTFHCRYINKAFELWFDIPFNQIIGKNIQTILSLADYEIFMENYHKINNGIMNYETVMRFQNNKERYVNVTLIPHIQKNVISGTYILISDITSHINYLATHDPLTKLPNRSLFMAYFTRALSTAEATQKAIVGLLFIDLDYFKNINDTFGHDMGDALLEKVAESLKSCLRKKDLLSRLGGDEFTVILEEVNSIQEIILVAQKICKSFEKIFYVSDREISITASVGISIYPDDALDTTTLLKNADMAMYRAKERGRNTFEFYTQEINEYMLQKHSLEISLHSALEKNQFEIYYQPIFDFQNNKLDGMEALLRWHHPEAGLILPAKFVSLLERMGMMNRIDDWVLNSACQQYIEWQMKNIPLAYIVVNISHSQFRRSTHLIEKISALLHEKNIQGKNITLEITEQSIIENIEYSRNLINQLKKLNISISVDSFEGSYSSLNYINSLAIDTIKINHHLISNLTATNGTEKLVAAIITMAKNLKIKVCAVGVESFEQYSILKTLGCDEIQGFLIFSPCRVEDATAILSKNFSINEHIQNRQQDRFYFNPYK